MKNSYSVSVAGAAVIVLAIVMFAAAGTAFAVPVGGGTSVVSSESEGLRALWTTDSAYNAPEGAVVVKIVGSIEPGWTENTWVTGDLKNEITVFPQWDIRGATLISVNSRWIQRLDTWTEKEWSALDAKFLFALVDWSVDGLPGSKRGKDSNEQFMELPLLSGERGTLGLIGDGWILPFWIDKSSKAEEGGTYYLVVTTTVEKTPTPETPAVVVVPPVDTQQFVPPAGYYFLLGWTGGPDWIMWDTSVRVLSALGNNPSVLLQWEQWSAPPTGEESVVYTTPKPAGAVWPTNTLKDVKIMENYSMPTTYGGGEIHFYWRENSTCPFPERTAPHLDLKWAPNPQPQQAWAYWDGESTWLWWVPIAPTPSG